MMETTNQANEGTGKPINSSVNDRKVSKGNKSNQKAGIKKNEKENKGEVLLSLPGGLKYQLPGKRQRVILGSVVIGLNLLLVLAVALYFYVPGFKEFVYNYGR